MSVLTRGAAFVLVFAALAATGCSSNNTGKIVGKWKATNLDTPMPLPGGAEVAVVFEFTADNKFSAYGLATIAGNTKRFDQGSGTYRLGMGDTVYLENLNPPQNGKAKSRESVSINGDTMTIRGESGKKDMQLTRMKE